MTHMRAITIFALLVASVAICPSCKKATDAPAAKTPTDPTFNPLDPLRGAPEPWDRFLGWADARLTVIPKPVSLPRNPTLPAPSRGVVHLDERLATASMTCEWQAPTDNGAALLSLGPFRSDRPTQDWLIEQPRAASNAAPLMTAQGFSVRSEDIGRITLDIKVPWGEHVDLIWSTAGKIRLPLPSRDRSWTLSVTTDGLADWAGPLEQLAIRTDGTGTGVVEIKSIKLFGRENAFPKPTGVSRVNLNRELRTSLYAHTPATITFDNVEVPTNGKLQTGLGFLASEKESHAPVTFTVSIKYADQTTKPLSQTLHEPGLWRDVSVSLAAFSGKTVSISLTATGPGGDVALWGNPVVYEPTPQPPIVIVYLIDALAAKHVNLYGYTRDTMPHLSKLAKGGVWFSNAFANSPKTVNSIPDIFFSMPTERHGVIQASFRAPNELVSLAEVFRSAGFATASFCTNVNAGPRQNLDQGFDHFFDRIAYWWTENADRTVPIDDVTDWMTHHADRPMLLYIHTAEPHGPYAPPDGFAGKFDTGYHGPINGGYDRKRHGFKTARTPEEIAHVVSLYDEECAYADHRLHAFLDTLRASGALDRTSLVVTADHGEEFLEHGAWTHGEDLYTEVQRVPLLFVGPKVTARGPVAAPVQLHDLMPTLLDEFELPEPYALNGDSLMPFLTKQVDEFNDQRRDALSRRTLFASNHAYLTANVIEATVIDGGKWKLLYRFDRARLRNGQRPMRFELFDLPSDRDEQHDVINANQVLARKLIGRLIAYRRTQPPYKSTIDTNQLELDPDQLRELQSLGYIGQFENDKE